MGGFLFHLRTVRAIRAPERKEHMPREDAVVNPLIDVPQTADQQSAEELGELEEEIQEELEDEAESRDNLESAE